MPHPGPRHAGRSSDNENATVGFAAVAVCHAALAVPLLLQPQSVAE